VKPVPKSTAADIGSWKRLLLATQYPARRTGRILGNVQSGQRSDQEWDSFMDGMDLLLYGRNVPSTPMSYHDVPLGRRLMH
jgi:hypothetical protein